MSPSPPILSFSACCRPCAPLWRRQPSACAQPLPQDKRDYAGTWQNDDSSVQLTISADGRLDYSRQQVNSSTAISGPIKAFEGNRIQVGFGPFSSDFNVSEAPHLNSSGMWSMTVDGLYLNRVQ